MLNHIRMGKLAGWKPRFLHERVRESYIMNFVYCKREYRDLPYHLSADRKKHVQLVYHSSYYIAHRRATLEQSYVR